MQDKVFTISVGLSGVIVGLIMGSFILSQDGGKGIENEASMSSAMDSMTSALVGKTGDDFDKEFLREMIEHHEGAVEMANLALANANHEEIKNLANAIVSAQTTEIDEMKSWYQAWYGR